MIFLIIFLLLLAALLLAAYYFVRVAIYPKVIPYAETYRRMVADGKIVPAEFESWPKEEIWIRSPFDYNLHGFYFPLEGARKTIVIVHGITWSLFGSVPYMPIFRKRGYNVLVYDHRYHGLSGGENCTFGRFEKYDLKTVVDWALERLGPGGIVATHGESLGAATVLQHAGIDPRIAFTIADCPYSDLYPLFAYRLKAEYHLPGFPLLQIASRICYRICGMKFEDVRPIEAVRDLATPILFCHGVDDDYIPPQMSVDMQHARRKGLTRLYLAPNARHAQSYWNNQVEYDQKVGQFLAEIGL